VQEYPQPIEDAYTARLLRRTTQARELLDERLGPLLKRFADDIDAASKTAKRGDTLMVVRHDQDTLEEITRRLISVTRTTSSAFTRQAPSGERFTRQQARAMDRGASGALKRSIRRVHGISVTQSPEVTEGMIDAWVFDNVELIGSVDERYFADVERVLAEGLETGRTTRQLTADVERRFEVSQSRARLIVRDQLGTLNSQITQARQTELGVESYIWRDSGDERVRPTHEDFNGQTFTWADGSPEGHPGEPIQCFPGDIIVSFRGLRKLYRRWYDGEIVVVKTEAGTLRGTPNHPILTTRGWLPFEQLQEGDQVIEHPGDPGGLGDHDRHQVRLDQVWELLGGVGPRDTRAGEFHGDASPDDQVDVVHIDGRLVVDGPALGDDRIEQLALAMADKPRASAGLGAPMRQGLAAAASRRVSRRDSRDALALGHSPLHGEHGLGSPASVAAGLDEPAAEDRSRGADLGGQGLARLPAGVAARQVTEVVRGGRFRGHVYNLETVEGWYVASELVVHNCRCTADPVIPDPESLPGQVA
jgi:SPP1 gp7 family putative phage head morphogenesis protein